MKKFYTVIAMFLAMATAEAQNSVDTALKLSELGKVAVTNSGKAFAAVEKSGVAKASSLPDVSQIISEQPAGTLYKNMYRKCSGLDDGYEKTYDGCADDVVVSEDGKKLYIKSPFPALATGWIVGDMDESGNVSFKFPQVVYHQDANEMTGATELTGYAYKVILDNVNYKVNIDQTTQTVNFKWENGTLKQVNADDVIAMTNAGGQFAGYASYANEYSVLTDTPVKPDAESTASTYLMTYTDYATRQEATKNVKLIIEGDEVYLGRFYNDYWIKGTLSGNKVIFPTGQYLGTETAKYPIHEYMMGFEISADNTQAFELDNLEFTYDEQAGTLTNDKVLGVNVGKGDAGLMAIFMNPTLTKTNYVAAAPAKPEILSAMKYNENGEGTSAVVYSLSNASADGGTLDPECIYYNIYLDGKLQTFKPADYMYLSADMTDIPYGYYDVNYEQSGSGATGYDFQLLSNMQCVYFYKAFNVVGVKAIYVDGSNRLESEMAEYDVTSGISNAVADGVSAEKSVTYYDLSGRKVSAPAKGIYMKTVEMENGQRKTIKFMK